MTFPLLAITVFSAALMQTISGFGFALLVMPLLTLTLGLEMSAPLVALIGLTLYAINLSRYRQSLNKREIARLALAAALGVPVGLWILVNVPETAVRFLLGLLLTLYALYTLLKPASDAVPKRRWGLGAGFLAGCLGGAYNVPGPPVIVYGSLRRWPRDEFRGVLQALFLVNAILVVAAHGFARHMTTAVFTHYAVALPALLIGILLGARLDHRVQKEHFRKLTTGLILLLGISLML